MEDTSWINRALELAQYIVSSPALPAVISAIIGYWATDLVSETADQHGWKVTPSQMRGIAFAICYLLFVGFALSMGISVKGTNAAYGFLGGAAAIGYFHGKKAVENLKGSQ